MFAPQPPMIASLSQTSVTTGRVFTIAGSGFYPSLVSGVLVGGQPVTFQAVSDSEITVVAGSTPGTDLPVVVLTTQGVSNDDRTITNMKPQ